VVEEVGELLGVRPYKNRKHAIHLYFADWLNAVWDGFFFLSFLEVNRRMLVMQKSKRTTSPFSVNPIHGHFDQYFLA
jgi:hypothetical protein